MSQIVFWGATGQAKVLKECVEAYGLSLVALFENNLKLVSPYPDIPLYYGEQGFLEWRQQHQNQPCYCLVAIGGANGQARSEIQSFLTAHGLQAYTAVHKTAFIAANAQVGIGSQILAQAAVCVEASIGEACIINTGATIDHECRLGNGVHIAPGAHLAGEVCVGDFTMVGTGAVVLPHIIIGENTIIGAGAVVTRDIPAGVIAYGNPARIIKNRT